jgi:hypothetical protein
VRARSLLEEFQIEDLRLQIGASELAANLANRSSQSIDHQS